MPGRVVAVGVIFLLLALAKTILLVHVADRTADTKESGMIEDEEEPTLEERIADYLRDKTEFDVYQVGRQFDLDTRGTMFKRTIWSATEQLLRENGLVFVPKAGKESGVYARASAMQTVRRGEQFRKTAARKRDRSLVVFQAADENELPPHKKRALQLTMDKIVQIRAAENSLKYKRKLDPKTSPIMQMPRPKRRGGRAR